MITQHFDQVVEHVRSSNNDEQVPQAVQLEIYGLYKQATEGDVKGSKPSRIKLVSRTKYEAWAACKGMSTQDAMQGYIDRVGQYLVAGVK